MSGIESEFGLIDWIRRNRGPSGEGVITDIGDDMAVLGVGAERVLVTTDMLLEGTHFDLKTATIGQVGYKAMACSLSDCAAMAALPLAAVVAVALPRDMAFADVQQLHEGMQRAAAAYDCPVVGGDTTSWDRPLAIDVTMLARPGGIEPVLRSGAKAGDVIMVTGELGGSLAGRHLEFLPRVAEARALAEQFAVHAMIDVSDGLASDLGHVCEESGVEAIVDAGAVPISAAATAAAGSKADALAAALGDGEDYELLFCVRVEDADEVLRSWAERCGNVRLSKIGVITDGSAAAEPSKVAPATAAAKNRVFLRQVDGSLAPVTIGGWDHFSE